MMLGRMVIGHRLGANATTRTRTARHAMDPKTRLTRRLWTSGPWHIGHSVGPTMPYSSVAFYLPLPPPRPIIGTVFGASIATFSLASAASSR